MDEFIDINIGRLEEFKASLKLEYPILGVHYLDDISQPYEIHQDTACTALGRVFNEDGTLVLNLKQCGQSCDGGDYFMKFREISDADAIHVYVEDEHIFQDEKVCQKYLGLLPRMPDSLKGKYVLIKRLEANDLPKVVIFLVNPAQANRIIGLANYKNYSAVQFLPNQPTCLALFAPIVTQAPHINFLDYYDRYYQGCVGGKLIWPETSMIVSLNADQFGEVLDNLNKSPQGNYNRVNLNPKTVDPI